MAPTTRDHRTAQRTRRLSGGHDWTGRPDCEVIDTQLGHPTTAESGSARSKRSRVVDIWTGQRANALQRALRFTDEGFAQRLGIAVRTVAKWHANPDVQGTVVLDPMRPDRVQDAAKLARPVCGLHGLAHGAVGVVLAEPHRPAHLGLPATAPASTLPSSRVTGPGVLPLSTSSKSRSRS